MPMPSTSSSDSNYGPHFVIENSFDFSQYQDIFIKTKDKIGNINLLSKYYNNNGLCIALSVRYVIEERNFGLGGAIKAIFYG
ncbi:hypothetical protein [Candidatus Williamhamiltonella defendens]|uniref:Uncharacterized protein n=1 Tax=Candidatus Williamhamiltonella defendens TaxID=138072 RepID=A0A2D3TEB9_9ENTR|nr:hypothetical protein [Candidatus Hamiltonella defensa]ATW34034.1 hypothetical protein BJP43_06930 [Candidatus Hamiltonella defensa]